MQFEESFDKITNRIRSFKDVDRSRFRLDLTNGAFFEWNVLWQINSIFNRGNLPMYAVQCGCGRLDIVNEESFKRFHSALINDADSKLKCNLCLKVGVDFVYQTEVTPRVQEGLFELHDLFSKAVNENYMTLCWYLWRSLGIENEQLREIHASTDLIFDQYIKNNLEVFLQNNGLSQYRIDNTYHFPRQHMLCLLALNHIIEIDGLYDLIVSLGAIAESENFLIGDDGRSIHGVGLTIVKGYGDERDTVKFKISTVKKWLRERKYMKLAKVIQIAFNYELRNAFAHAEYPLTDSGVYLTRYKREITYAALQESFIAAYHLLSDLVSLIRGAREKFIADGGYSGGGWTITPHKSEKGFSVQLTSSSPFPRPTGKRRQT